MRTDFLVKKADLKETRFVVSDQAHATKANEVLLKIEQFAFTSNNVTYAADRKSVV